MIVVGTQNVNTALHWGIQEFQQLEQNPRNVVAPRGMRTIESPQPVCTVYYSPTERVLFSPTRDANPFFHFFEALWMLAGRNDVEFVALLNKRMMTFSDDGQRIWGAYGWRWRSMFGFDQIEKTIDLLRSDPDSRRGVIAMWSPDGDAIPKQSTLDREGVTEGGPKGKDVPCNTHLYFKIRQGKLQMTICNRSNDMIWGAYGANAVHMSMLQEYMADKLGVHVGLMRQMSDSLHVYLNDASAPLWEKLKGASSTEFFNLYSLPDMKPYPLRADSLKWDADLFQLLHLATTDGANLHEGRFECDFFKFVAVPLWRGWVSRDVKEVERCVAPDWRRAALEWLRRRS